ncbi:MAG: hypothetical protein AAGH45_06340 [Pseudomonadota bacterium]
MKRIQMIVGALVFGLAACSSAGPVTEPATRAQGETDTALPAGSPGGAGSERVIADRTDASTLYIPVTDGQCLLSQTQADAVTATTGETIRFLTGTTVYNLGTCEASEPTARVYVGRETLEDPRQYLTDLARIVRTPTNVNAILEHAFATGEAGPRLVLDRVLASSLDEELQRYTVTYVARVADRPARVLIAQTARVVAGRGVLFLHADPMEAGLNVDDIALRLAQTVPGHAAFDTALSDANPRQAGGAIPAL